MPVDEITEQAKTVKPGRAVLTVVAAVLFGIGWIVARIFAVLWLAFMWSSVAIREGWRASHGPSRAQQIETLQDQITQLKVELGRFVG